MGNGSDPAAGDGVEWEIPLFAGAGLAGALAKLLLRITGLGGVKLGREGAGRR